MGNGLTLPFSGDADSPSTPALSISNAGAGPAVVGTSTAPPFHTGSENPVGVHGICPTGVGVKGESLLTGVLGNITDTAGTGVLGTCNGSTGIGGIGVQGECQQPNGVGVHGIATAIEGTGVRGSSTSFYGVRGESQSSQWAGVGGTNDSGGPGVSGLSTASDGVQGTSQSSQHAGVSGVNGSGNGVHGVNGTGSGQSPSHPCGVWGESDTGFGVYGASKTGTAGEFAGSVNITGNVDVSADLKAHGGTFSSVAVTDELTAAKCKLGIVTATGGLDVSGGDLQAVAAKFSGNVSAADLTASGNLTVKGDVTVNGDIYLPGAADCAEEFDNGDAESPEPGSVVVIDTNGAVRKSTDAYDKKVAGVVSGAGGYRPGIVLDGNPSQKDRVAIALLGKVFCRVDARYSSIEVGDLLTTSPTAGHAMRAQDPGKAFGAVLGKALRGLEQGQDLIPILIALQ